VKLDTTKKCLSTGQTASQPRSLDGYALPHYSDYENTHMIARIPNGNMTVKFSDTVRDFRAEREAKGGLDAVSHLVKEFEHRKQGFDDEAKAIAENKSRLPDEELWKMKLRCQTWKKEYKSRLREAKAKLHKLGHSEVE
ncbi:hypothetical protein U1Q18_038086, partial [Sarracenia purpurea var. burkii]